MQHEGDIAAIRLNLGARIRALRDELSMTQKTFSAMISMDRSYFVGVETGSRNVSIENLCKIARGFDMSLSEMFEGVDDPESVARRLELMEELLRKKEEKQKQKDES